MYTTYIEVAHIKAISDFLPTSTLGEINAQSNLILLCPNHHKEYDKKLTDVHIKIAGMGIEPMLA